MIIISEPSPYTLLAADIESILIAASQDLNTPPSTIALLLSHILREPSIRAAIMTHLINLHYTSTTIPANPDLDLEDDIAPEGPTP